MLRKALGAFVLSLTAAVPASAADYNSRTHYYAVEYLKPAVGNDVSIIMITVNKSITAEEAEKLLRAEMTRALELFPTRGLTAAMAYAFVETGGKGSDQKVKLPDGSDFLIYTPASKQLQTEKQYDVARQPPQQPGKGINVSVTLEVERNIADGRVRFIGTTNLPTGMDLILTVRQTGGKYQAQDKVQVADGRFTSAWFSDRGKGVPLGSYEIEVTSSLPQLQSDAVRAVIGQKGENLSGAISTSMGSKMVAAKIKLGIP